jgi:hypothetical protein
MTLNERDVGLKPSPVRLMRPDLRFIAERLVVLTNALPTDADYGLEPATSAEFQQHSIGQS